MAGLKFPKIGPKCCPELYRVNVNVPEDKSTGFPISFQDNGRGSAKIHTNLVQRETRYEDEYTMKLPYRYLIVDLMHLMVVFIDQMNPLNRERIVFHFPHFSKMSRRVLNDKSSARSLWSIDKMIVPPRDQC
jgi:hypothetical protein